MEPLPRRPSSPLSSSLLYVLFASLEFNWEVDEAGTSFAASGGLTDAYTCVTAALLTILHLLRGHPNRLDRPRRRLHRRRDRRADGRAVVVAGSGDRREGDAAVHGVELCERLVHVSSSERARESSGVGELFVQTSMAVLLSISRLSYFISSLLLSPPAAPFLCSSLLFSSLLLLLLFSCPLLFSPPSLRLHSPLVPLISPLLLLTTLL